MNQFPHARLIAVSLKKEKNERIFSSQISTNFFARKKGTRSQPSDFASASSCSGSQASPPSFLAAEERPNPKAPYPPSDQNPTAVISHPAPLTHYLPPFSFPFLRRLLSTSSAFLPQSFKTLTKRRPPPHTLPSSGEMNFKGARMPSAPPKGAGALAKVALLGGAAVYAAMNSFYNVEGGHRAIVFNRIEGIKDKVYPEGTHLIIPWFERPIIYDVRARPNLVESTSGSRDLQMVRIGLRVLTRPMPEKLPTIYRTLGENFNERVLPSIIHETLKAVVAQYNASQLITQREAVSREIRKILTERARNFNIALDDVSITSLSFGKEFTHAIEAKQVAAQEAERAKFIVEKAEQDKRSAIIRAQGEAKSAELIGQAIVNNPAFISLRKIEAAREISHTMAASNNKVFLDSNDLLLGLQQLNVGGKNNK